MSQSADDGRLHLDIRHPVLVQRLQELHLVRLGVVAESPIEPSLPFVEVVRAHGLPRDRIVRIVRISQRLQLLHQSLVQLRRPAGHFSQYWQIVRAFQHSVNGLVGYYDGSGLETDATASSDTEEDRVLHLGVVHEFDDLVEEDSDRWRAHSVLCDKECLGGIFFWEYLYLR